MLAHTRPRRSFDQPIQLENRSVSQLIVDLVDPIRPILNQRDIQLELDIESIEAPIDVDLIQTVIHSLISNAIDSMPDGGELSLITIDGTCQWEIEVADNSAFEMEHLVPPNDSADNDLPVLLPFPVNDELRQAYQAAFAHHGQLQRWNCPLGGVAFTLVVPRRRIARVA